MVEIEGENLPLRKNQFVVLHASPQILRVSWQIQQCAMDILVFHAPIQKDGAHTVKAYWSDLESLLNDKRSPGAQLMALADANAHVRGGVVSGIGNHWPEKMDTAGRAMSHFIDQFALFAPQTFSENVDGAAEFTWSSNIAAPTRNDFVLLPSNWRGHTRVRVHYELDVSGGIRDHFMLSCDTEAELTPAKLVAMRRKPICDRVLLAHPTRSLIASEVWLRAPEVPWAMHSDDHLAILNTWTRAALCAIAHIRKSSPRK